MSESLVVPFNRPGFVGNEQAYMAQAVASGHISGDGKFTRLCDELLEKELGVAKVLLTTSCTHALEMAALLLDIQPADEVIVPSFTFASTVNAFVLRGAKPIFIDIRPDTLNLDEASLERQIAPATKAIVVMHYASVGCEMEMIAAIAARHGIPIVEDAAHALFARYRGQMLGTFGAFAALSFHETKNFICGEGGALLINDHQYVDRAEIVREKGTNRSRFFRGQVDKYTWVDIGSSYLLSDILAAFLFAQLEARERVQALRRRVFEGYAEGLRDWAASVGARLPMVPPHCQQNYHMFYLLMPSLTQRSAFIAHLARRDILSVFHYLPLHLSPMGLRWGYRPGDCPVTEDVSDRLVRLPFYNGLTPTDQARVIEAVREAPVG